MAQIAPLADLTSTWPYPLESDGWYRAHDALRADLAALAAMLDAFQRQLRAGTLISHEQAAAATAFYNAFVKTLHHHHQNEDAIAVPYLATRCAMPEKIAADHKELDALLDAFDAGLRRLLSRDMAQATLQRTLLPRVQADFVRLRNMIEPHLREEEQEVLPLMRRHFTPQEVEKHVVSKIMRSLDGESVGVFLRALSREERRAFMKQEHIPFFVRWILNHHAAKYEKRVWRPFQRLCLDHLSSAPAAAAH